MGNRVGGARLNCLVRMTTACAGAPGGGLLGEGASERKGVLPRGLGGRG